MGLQAAPPFECLRRLRCLNRVGERPVRVDLDAAVGIAHRSRLAGGRAAREGDGPRGHFTVGVLRRLDIALDGGAPDDSCRRDRPADGKTAVVEPAGPAILRRAGLNIDVRAVSHVVVHPAVDNAVDCQRTADRGTRYRQRRACAAVTDGHGIGPARAGGRTAARACRDVECRSGVVAGDISRHRHCPDRCSHERVGDGAVGGGASRSLGVGQRTAHAVDRGVRADIGLDPARIGQVESPTHCRRSGREGRGREGEGNQAAQEVSFEVDLAHDFFRLVSKNTWFPPQLTQIGLIYV